MTDADFPVTIFHNPSCGTSRNALAMIVAAGYAPRVVEYLQAGWSGEQLRELARAAGLTFRQLLRERGTPADALGLLAGEADEERILAAMIEHPVLVNRPIVATPRGVKLCRPSEVVFELLKRRPAQFVKEDGEVVRP